MKNIITIQHTQSVQHTNGMIGSWTDWDLTGLGIEQAKRIGERLCGEIKNKSYVLYSSDLLRAKRTARIVGGFLGLEPVLTDALREFYLGEAVGKSKRWAREHAECRVWPGTVDWAETIDGKPFAGAESKREVWNRLSGFLNQIMTSAEENAILVSHDGTLQVFYALWLGLDLNTLNKRGLSGKSGGVSFLYEDEEQNRVISRLNDLSYIR